MVKLLSFIFLVPFIPAYMGQGAVEYGIWTVLNVNECENPDQYPITLKVDMAKMNRTHDMFDAYIKTDEVIDASYGLEILVNKTVDGGEKPYSTISEASAAEFLKRHVKVLCFVIFENLGFGEEYCFPLPEGEHILSKLVLDFCDMPDKAPVGKFHVRIYLIKNNKKVGCIDVNVEFMDEENGYDGCCDEKRS